MRETWYVLEDGSTVDPNEVAPDDNGVLRHKDGVAVQMRGDVPRSRGVDVEHERANATMKDDTAKGKAKSKASTSKDMKPEDQASGYKTRDAKAD